MYLLQNIFFWNISIFFLDAYTRIYMNLKYIQKYTNGKNELYLYIMMNIQLIIITTPSLNTYVLMKNHIIILYIFQLINTGFTVLDIVLCGVRVNTHVI